MPSLKRSVGSKSGNLHLGAGGNAEDGFFCCEHEELSSALRSSWISRFRLPPLPLLSASRPPPTPPPAAPSHRPAAFDSPLTSDGVLGLKHTISTDESRTPTSISNLNSAFSVRRHLSNIPKKPASRPPWTPPRAQGVTGFGPFQVRTGRTLSGRAEGNPGDDDGVTEALGRRYYGKDGNFALFQRMDHGGEDRSGEVDGEQGKIGFCKGRQQKSLNREEIWDRNTSFLLQKWVPDGRNAVHPLPIFQFQRSIHSSCLGDSRVGGHGEMARDRGLFVRPVGEVNSHFVDTDPASSSRKLSQMRSASNGNLCSPSYLPPPDLINESTSQRACDQPLPVDPWRASSSVQHAARSRGVALHDVADDTAPSRTFCEPHILYHNRAPRHLERHSPAYMNEPEEPFSFWNMGRFKRKNTVSSVSATIALTCNLSRKQNPNIDVFLPSKSRKLSSED